MGHGQQNRVQLTSAINANYLKCFVFFKWINAIFMDWCCLLAMYCACIGQLLSQDIFKGILCRISLKNVFSTEIIPLNLHIWATGLDNMAVSISTKAALCLYFLFFPFSLLVTFLSINLWAEVCRLQQQCESGQMWICYICLFHHEL